MQPDFVLEFIEQPVIVKMNGKRIGEIRKVHTENGNGLVMYQYFPKGKAIGGELFSTLESCKRSLY